ncbi:beta-lactamase family protein [Orrella sp. NBD-18]|uniref:Beta-lactamase family protein n=1 Tax=Sheuella amnicola TaxID=2707330 RepID=A0A6B2QWT9_9BURK|nr:serine hydrolase domain-containing protein [Sheuella amnicola]NDY82581.1 beta-lactamase family protein [Sheuella amnicola]
MKKIIGSLIGVLTLSSSLTVQAQQPTGQQPAKQQQPPLPIATPQSQGFSAEGIKRIDAFMKQEIANNQMPGAVLAVAKNGKLVIYEAYGYRNKATSTPMTKDTIFELASMTKIMTAVSALTFYEEGSLTLKSPVSRWFPQFKNMKVAKVAADGTMTTENAKNQITIQDLMRHTTGLTYGGRGDTPVHKQFPAGSVVSALTLTGPEFMEKLSSAALLHEPGTVWNYGFGLDVLGLIQEKMTGKPLGQIMRERIWDKVGMVDSGFAINDKNRDRFAHPLPTDPITGKPQSMDILSKPLKFDCGGGCAYGTAADYLRFGQMLINGGTIDGKRVLGPQTVAFMTSNHLGKDIKNELTATEAGRAGYGFGLSVAVRMDRGIAAINGNVGDYTWNGAYGTTFWADPKEKMVVVMMAATPGEIRKEYRERINALIYGALEK